MNFKDEVDFNDPEGSQLWHFSTQPFEVDFSFEEGANSYEPSEQQIREWDTERPELRSEEFASLHRLARMADEVSPALELPPMNVALSGPRASGSAFSPKPSAAT